MLFLYVNFLNVLIILFYVALKPHRRSCLGVYLQNVIHCATFWILCEAQQF